MDLATLNEPGWNKDLVRKEVDILELLDRVDDNFAQAAPLLSAGENTYTLFCWFFKTARASLVQRLEGNASAREEPADALSLPTDTAALSGIFNLDFLDNELFWNYPAVPEL